jgi:hypothetical protein
MRSRYGVVFLGTALAFLAPFSGAANAVHQVPRAIATERALPSLAPAPRPSPGPSIPFGALDAALLALAGVPVVAFGLRRRRLQRDASPAPRDRYTAA